MSYTTFISDAEFDAGVRADIRANAGTGTYNEWVAKSQEDLIADMPARYREMLDHIPGEHWFTMGQNAYSARGGETTFSPSIATAQSGSIRLFYNYPDSVAWSERTVHNEVTSDYWTFDGTANLITLNASGPWGSGGLNRGDRMIVEYDHSLASVPGEIKSVMLHRVAYRAYLWHYIQNERDSEAPEVAHHLNEYNAAIAAWRNNEKGIPEFDNLVLALDPDTSESGGGGRWGSVEKFRAG